jgi:hypothetical protein
MICKYQSSSRKRHEKLTNVTRPRCYRTPRRVGWSSGTGRGVRFTTWKRGAPRIRILAPTASACSRRHRAGRRWLAISVRHDWFIPYVTPSALHHISLKRRMGKKKTHIPVQAESSHTRSRSPASSPTHP